MEIPKKIKIPKIDTKKVLKDENGIDLICHLCENWDNETNEYYPIHEGEQKTFQGKKYHLNCYRYLKKHSKELL